MHLFREYRSHQLIFRSLLFLIACHATHASAQKEIEKQEINIVKDYNIFIEEPTKIVENIDYNMSNNNSATKEKLTYNMPEKILQFQFEPTSVAPMNFKSNDTFFTKQNFIKVGVGTLLNPIIEWSHHNINSKLPDFNVYLKHHSAWMEQQMYQKYSETNAQIETNLKYYGFDITPSVFFENKIYSFFGNLNESQNQQSAGRMYNRMGFEVTAEKNSEEIKAVSLSAVVGSNYNIDHVDLSTNSHSNNEYNYYFKPAIRYSFSDKIVIKLAGGAEVIQTNFYGKSHRLVLNAMPELKIKSKTLNLSAGINFVKAQTIHTDNFYFLPSVASEVQIVPNFVLFYSVWERNLELNKFNQILIDNPYALLYNTEIPLTKVENRKAGFKGNYKGISYNCYFVQKIARDYMLYGNDSVNPRLINSVIEPNFTINNLSAQASFKFNSNISFDFRNDFFLYELTQNKYAYNLPNVYSSLGIFYRFNQKITSHLEGYMIAGSKTLINNNLETKSLNFDLNVSAEYNIYKNFYIFANLINVLNTKVNKIVGYNSYGTSAQIGLRILY